MSGEAVAGPSKAVLADWIRTWMARELKVDAGAIALDRTFIAYGMDSIHATMLVGDLEEYLRRRLSPTLAWDYPTPDALADHLVHEDAAPSAASPDDRELLARLDELPDDVVERLLSERLGRAPSLDQ